MDAPGGAFWRRTFRDLFPHYLPAPDEKIFTDEQQAHTVKIQDSYGKSGSRPRFAGGHDRVMILGLAFHHLFGPKFLTQLLFLFFGQVGRDDLEL